MAIHRNTRPLLSMLLSVSLLSLLTPIATTSAAAPDELRQAIDARSKELSEINAKIAQTERELDGLEVKSNTLNREISKYNYEINQLDLGIRSSEIIIDKLGLEIESLSYEVLTHEQMIERKQAAIVTLLRQLQEKSNESILLIFLKNRSLAESVFESNGLAQLEEGLAVEVGALESIKEQLAGELTTTEQKKQQVEIEHGTLATKRTISGQKRSEKKDLLGATKNQENIYQQQLTELEERQAEIGKEIEEIEEELRKSFDPTLLPSPHPGVFSVPILTNVVISQSYGGTSFAQQAYKSKFHNGVDYAAPLGTPIVAARNGKVIAVGNNGKYQYGKYVLIEHDNGLTSLYAHLSNHATTQGASVSVGEVIGYVGSTGYSFGNHLHFTIYWSTSLLLKDFPTCNCGLVPVGVTVNPLEYI